MKKHLSFFGVGPLFFAITFLATLSAMLLNRFGYLPTLQSAILASPAKILGALLILGAAILWLHALLISKIDVHIKENHLVTTGAYAWVRNPIYTAIMCAAWGVLLWSGNLYLLLLCPVYWLLLTALVKCTEEKWLADLYGQEYKAYCRRVNRCIPRPPKKSR